MTAGTAAMLQTATAAEAFIKGGKSRFTVVSKKTGTRFTYRANQPKENGPIFVSVLTGSNNESDYSYMGLIDSRTGEYRQTAKSKIAASAPSNTAFQWTYGNISQGKLPTDQIEFWHEGRCAHCGRALTDPESIESGFGPICGHR